MATAIGTQPVDPAKGAKFPITISGNMLRDPGSKKRKRIGVRYTHWPQISGNTKTVITSSRDGNSYDLSLRNDEKDEFKNKGFQHSSSTIALFYDSVEKSFTLDKLDAEFCFNVRSPPGQKDGSRTHPSLDSGPDGGEQNGHGLFDGGAEDDDDMEDATPDPNNPYDYRHFLNQGHRSPSPLPSYASSPVPQHNFNSSPALVASSPRPQKPLAPTSRSSRPKQRVNERPSYLSPKPRQQEVDADNEDSDPNELVIDMGDSSPVTNNRPWRSALGVLNERGRNSGPISLRSAASSMSPSVHGRSPSEDENDLEQEAQSDADADDDVEEIDLDNTAADPAPPPPEEVVTPGNGWDDDDDELEAELALALEEERAKSDIEEAAREKSLTLVNGESSEESEEE